ncbi:ankyrin [Wilcoxina mikolae CBS 423.85]|nr:ankyrin [Wilcoxina mikolae CBS 423.85]
MSSRRQKHLLSPDDSPWWSGKRDRFKKWFKPSSSRASSVRSRSPSPAPPPQLSRSTTPSSSTAAAQPANATTGSQTQNAPQLSISGAGNQSGQTRSPATKLWEDAFASLSSEDQHILGPLGVGDCRDVLGRLIESTIEKKRQCEEEAWTYTWRGKTINLSETFDSILAWMNKFKQIGDIIVQYDPVHSALDSQKRGALLVGIEAIGNAVTRCTIYESLYLGGAKVTDGLEGALVALYSAALVYLAKAKSYFCQNPGKRIVSAFFDTDEHTNFLVNIQTKESELQKYLNLAKAEYSQAQLRGLLEGLRRPIERIEVKVDEIQDRFKEIRDVLSAERRVAILKWLSVVKYEAHHSRALADREPGTGAWLLRRPDFNAWRNSDKSTLLWLYGNPGAGKTKLTALLAQSKGGPLLPPCVSEYDKQEQRGFSGSLDLQKTVNLIVECANIYPRIIIVIDTLDECLIEDPVDRCSQNTRAALFEALDTIQQRTQSLVHIFVSSRRDIRRQFVSVPNVSIQATDNANDIECFVTEEVGRCIDKEKLLGGDVSDELRDEIISKLVEQADGMFLWAALQIQNICCEETPRDVQNALGRLSTTLAETYSLILREIERKSPSRLQLAIKTLLWVMGSKRLLTPDELDAAISVSEANRKLSKGIVEGIGIKRLLGLCHNFLVIDEQLKKVCFAHLTVHEFLETDPRFTKVDAHTLIAETCFDYWHLASLLDTQNPDAKDIFDRRDILLWVMRANTGPFMPRLALTLPPLKLYQIHWSCSWEFPRHYSVMVCDVWRETDSPLPMMAAAFFGFGENISEWWKYLTEVNSVNGQGITVLQVACEGGHEWAVRFLLAKGADPHAVRIRYHQSESIVMNDSHYAVIKLLLDAGVCPESFACSNIPSSLNLLRSPRRGAAEQSEDRILLNSPLKVAAWVGNEALARLLLDYGANVNGFDEKGDTVHSSTIRRGTALKAAVENGHETVVRLLLERGAATCDALEVAVLKKQWDVIILLLANEAEKKGGPGRPERELDINSKFKSWDSVDEQYITAIEAAVDAGKISVVQALLEGDAQIPTGTFVSAIESARFDIASLLLENGANINEKRIRLHRCVDTAMSFAVEAGNINTIRFLFERGADLTGVDRYCSILFKPWTPGCCSYLRPSSHPLYIASRNGRQDIVTLLLEEARSMRATDDICTLALTEAIKYDQFETAELLLGKGPRLEVIDINAGVLRYSSDPKPQTPLALAFRGHKERCGLSYVNDIDIFDNERVRQSLDLILFLLVNGANATGKKQYGALATAAAFGDIGLVKLLLENGGDINNDKAFNRDKEFNPLEMSIAFQHQDIAIFLLSNGAEASEHALLAAAYHGMEEMRLRSRSQSTPLRSRPNFNRCRCGHNYVLFCMGCFPWTKNDAEFMLKKGADVNRRIEGKDIVAKHDSIHRIDMKQMFSALDFATMKQHHEIVHTLLEAGTSVNGGEGASLRCAASFGDETILRWFFERGGDANLRDDQLRKGYYRNPMFVRGSALDTAAAAGNIKNVKLLLDKGADPNGGDGLAMCRAAEAGHVAIVELLLEGGDGVNSITTKDDGERSRSVL